VIECALQAIDFIEEHLREDVGVGDIADAVGYSLYHFSRTFNATVQHTPYDYLMRRRLSESACDLIATDRLIIEIAYDYCFANPETYTRAFRRMFGSLPSIVRSRGWLPYRRAMPRLTSAHLVHRTRACPPHPRLLELPSLSVFGLMSLVHDDYADPDDTSQLLWRLLARDLVARQPVSESQATTEPIWAIIRYPEAWREEGEYLYMAGIQAVEGPLLVPRLTVPATRYVRCETTSAPSGLMLARDYVAHTWLPRAGHGVLAPLELLAYAEFPTKPGVAPAWIYMALD
jgi:AraC family transcriptional regulator